MSMIPDGANDSLKLDWAVLNPSTTTIHQTINGKYRMVIERAPSTKGIDGFKVEVNSDDMYNLVKESQILYDKAKSMTGLEVK